MPQRAQRAQRGVVGVKQTKNVISRAVRCVHTVVMKHSIPFRDFPLPSITYVGRS
jgi:hypothetical protein